MGGRTVATHTVTVNGTTAVVTVRGEVDLRNAADLLGWVDAGLTTGCRVVELDFAALDFLDSSGIWAVVHGQHHARERGTAKRCG